MNNKRDQDQYNMKVPGYFNRWHGCLGILILALGLTCCSTAHKSNALQKQYSTLHFTNAVSGPVNTTMLQAQVMRFADTYVALVAQSCDDITTATTNADLRLAAAQQGFFKRQFEQK